ncbi:MAG: hypothetical protein WAN65_13705 [Candidatus Sulfotelmatobacter sp.]
MKKSKPTEVTIRRMWFAKDKQSRFIAIGISVVLNHEGYKWLPPEVGAAYKIMRGQANGIDTLTCEKGWKHLLLEFRTQPDQVRPSLRLLDVEAHRLKFERAEANIIFSLVIEAPLTEKLLDWGKANFSYNTFATFDLSQLELVSADEEEEIAKQEASLGLTSDEPKDDGIDRDEEDDKD